MFYKNNNHLKIHLSAMNIKPKYQDKDKEKLTFKKKNKIFNSENGDR